MKQYRLTTRYKFYYSVIALLSLVPAAGFTYLFRHIAVCYSPILLLIAFAIIRTIMQIKKEAIFVSEKSIVYQNIFITIESDWSDVKEIRNTFINHLLTIQDCLAINETRMKIVKPSILSIMFLSTTWQAQKPRIPLSCFSENWRDSELGQQIKQYAPHLFEKENPRKSVKSVAEL